MIVKTLSLIEPFGYKSDFTSFYGAIGLEFQFEYPLAANDLLLREKRVISQVLLSMRD